jgi:hypothetical protein
MPRPRNPRRQQFRPMQVVSPVPSKRRYGKAKWAKKSFIVYVSNMETGEDIHGIPVFAVRPREAIEIARKRLYASPVLRKITHAVYTAVEVKE